MFGGFMVAGGVPRDWRLQRSRVTLAAPNALPFVDVEAPETHDYLTRAMAAELIALGYERPLDVATVRGRDRLLTRAIALHAYTSADDDGMPSYSGIRYLSRISSAWECWAIFEGTAVTQVGEQPIELNDPDLKTVEQLFGLRVF